MIRVRATAPTEFNVPIVGDPDGRCEYDALRIGGDFTPGVCVVSRAGIPITWDKRKGYGFAGATLIYTGDDLAEFETTFTFWRQDQIDAWKDWAKKYLTKSLAQPQVGNLGVSRAVAERQVADAKTAASAPGLTPQQQQSFGAQADSAQRKLDALSSASPYLTNVPKPKALGVYHPTLAEIGITKIVPKLVGAFTQASQGKWTKTIDWYQWRGPQEALGRPKESTPDWTKPGPTAQDAWDLELEKHRKRFDDLVKQNATGHN